MIQGICRGGCVCVSVCVCVCVIVCCLLFEVKLFLVVVLRVFPAEIRLTVYRRLEVLIG